MIYIRKKIIGEVLDEPDDVVVKEWGTKYSKRYDIRRTVWTRIELECGHRISPSRLTKVEKEKGMARCFQCELVRDGVSIN